MTPAYAGILGMPMQLAVVASLASIFGQGLLNVPFLLPQRLPGAGPRRPLINYPVLVLWYPITAAGTLIGAHWQHAVPDWFRNVMLLVVSLVVSMRVVYQAVQSRRQEKAAQVAQRHRVHLAAQQANAAAGCGSLPTPNDGVSAAASEHRDRPPLVSFAPDAASAAPPADSLSPLIVRRDGVNVTPSNADDSAFGARRSRGITDASASGILSGSTTLANQSGGRHTRASVSRASIFSGNSEGIDLIRSGSDTDDSDDDDDEANSCPSTPGSTGSATRRKRLPKYPLVPILSLLAVVAIVTASRYGSRVSRCNGTAYWMSLAGGGLGLLTLFIAWRIWVWYVARQVARGEMPSHAQQIPPTWSATVVYPVLSLAAGFCSSTVGVGGGTLINPLLIEAGLKPEEASATGGMFTFLIALGSTVTALTSDSSDELSPLWLVVFAFVGFLSTVCGRMVLLPYFRRRGATSVIVAALALSLILTFVAVVAYGAVSFREMNKYGVPLQFTPLCPNPQA